MFIGEKKGTHQAQEPMDTNAPMLRRTSLVWFMRRWTMRAWYILYGGRIRSWILNIASLLLSIISIVFTLVPLLRCFSLRLPPACQVQSADFKTQSPSPAYNILPKPNRSVFLDLFIFGVPWMMWFHALAPWPLGSLGASCRKGETGSAGTCWQVPGHRPRRPVGRPWMPPPVTLSIPTMLGGFAFVRNGVGG